MVVDSSASVISESQDETGRLVRTMDCTKEVEKLIDLAGVSITYFGKLFKLTS